MDITLRALSSTDSFDTLTALLHRAYARLGAMGLNYTAVDQSVEVTQRRAAAGHCLVAERAGQIVGTVTVSGAYDPNTQPGARMTPWFYRQDIAHFHQLAVDPDAQGKGIGNRLVQACEAWAKQRNHTALALDTALPAHYLRQRYAGLGFVEADELQWPGKAYRSVIMVKPLNTTMPSTADLEHRCAVVRTLWAHMQARDWAAARACLADNAVMHWPCTQERFDNAESIIRVNAEYPEGWSIHIIAVDALADGRVQSVVRVDHSAQSFFANSCFTFEGPRIAAIAEYWGMAESPPAWRTRECLGGGYHRLPGSAA
jgi:GNAT superfamily N-acetyltransferase